MCRFNIYFITVGSLGLCGLIFVLSLFAVIAGIICTVIGTILMGALQVVEGTALQIVGGVLLYGGLIVLFTSSLALLIALCIHCTFRGKDSLLKWYEGVDDEEAYKRDQKKKIKREKRRQKYHKFKEKRDRRRKKLRADKKRWEKDSFLDI